MSAVTQLSLEGTRTAIWEESEDAMTDAALEHEVQVYPQVPHGESPSPVLQLDRRLLF